MQCAIFLERSETHLEMFLECYPAGLAAAGASVELIVDEVLAVGDARISKKSLGKMRQVAGQGRTVLFVSHNLAAISELCGRVIWVDKGMIVCDGDSRDVVGRYSWFITHHAANMDAR